LEWLLYVTDHFKEKNIDVEWAVFEIAHFLRMISLTDDVGTMKDFLCNVLVDL